MLKKEYRGLNIKLKKGGRKEKMEGGRGRYLPLNLITFFKLYNYFFSMNLLLLKRY